MDSTRGLSLLFVSRDAGEFDYYGTTQQQKKAIGQEAIQPLTD